MLFLKNERWTIHVFWAFSSSWLLLVGRGAITFKAPSPLFYQQLIIQSLCPPELGLTMITDEIFSRLNNCFPSSRTDSFISTHTQILDNNIDNNIFYLSLSLLASLSLSLSLSVSLSQSLFLFLISTFTPKGQKVKSSLWVILICLCSVYEII